MSDETLGILTSDLATVLRVPARTVRWWAKDEHWRHKVGSDGRWYYDTDDVWASARVMKAMRRAGDIAS